ncbi:MAG: hypothetical protein ACI4KR_09545, partial [Ruminiclostridium sp.]
MEMKLFKKMLSVFLSAVIMVGMACAGSVSAGAAGTSEKYGSQYQVNGAYVPGSDDYRLTFYYPLETALAIVQYSDCGYSAIFSIMFENKNEYFSIMLGTKGMLVSNMNGGGKAEEDKNVSVTIDWASDELASIITIKSSSAADKYIDLLKNSPSCSVSIYFAGSDGLWNYDSMTGGLTNISV